MKVLRVTIAKVGESLWDGDAHSVTVTCTDGQVTILAQHEPFVAPTTPCTIVVHDTEEKRHEIVVEEPGVLEVSNNQATIIL